MSTNQILPLVPFNWIIVLGLIIGCRAVPQSDVTCHIGESPACCPEKVHVIFVDSPFDVLKLGKIERVAESLKESGCNIEVYNYHRHGNDVCLAKRIRELRTEQPTGRIVVIGYSSGALMIERALAVLEPEQVCVDVAIYIDSNILKVFGATKPPQNVGRTLLVYRQHVRVPDTPPRRETYRINVRNHFHVPSNQHCIDILASELWRQSTLCCP